MRFLRFALMALVAWLVMVPTAGRTEEPAADASVASESSARTLDQQKMDRMRALLGDGKSNDGKGAQALAPWKKSAEPEVEASPGLTLTKALFVCLGFLSIGVYGFRRFGIQKKVPGGRRMRVVERIALTGKASLLLVKVDGREFLVSAGSESTSIQPLNDQLIELEEVIRSEGFDQSTEQVCSPEIKFSA